VKTEDHHDSTCIFKSMISKPIVLYHTESKFLQSFSWVRMCKL